VFDFGIPKLKLFIFKRQNIIGENHALKHQPACLQKSRPRPPKIIARVSLQAIVQDILRHFLKHRLDNLQSFV
jgi:hypothetical protein